MKLKMILKTTKMKLMTTRNNVYFYTVRGIRLKTKALYTLFSLDIAIFLMAFLYSQHFKDQFEVIFVYPL